MPEQSFEKQMQQLMQGFQPEPDDAVWQHVSVAIKKDKKRRRFFFWWIFSIAGITAFIFFRMYADDHSTKLAQHPSENKKLITESTQSSATDSKIQKQNNQQKILLSDTDTLSSSYVMHDDDASYNHQKTSIHQKEKVIVATSFKQFSDKQIRSTSSFTKRGQDRVVNSVNNDKKNQHNAVIEKAIHANTDTEHFTAADLSIEQNQITASISADKHDSAAISEESIKEKDSSNLVNELKQPVKLKNPKKAKLVFGVTAGGGIANISSGFFGSSDKLFTSNENFVGNSGIGSAAPMPASMYKASGNYIETGLSVNYHTGKYFSFQTGLLYSQYIMSLMQTAVALGMNDPFAGSSGSYADEYRKERYQYLNIPLYATGNILSKKKWQLQWVGGINNAILLNANRSVRLKMSNGTETLSDESINLQLKRYTPSLRTGLNMNFRLNKNLIQFQPFIQHSLLPYTQQGNRYVYAGGLSVNIYFMQ